MDVDDEEEESPDEGIEEECVSNLRSLPSEKQSKPSLGKVIKPFLASARLACKLVPDNSDREQCEQIVDGVESGGERVTGSIGDLVNVLQRYSKEVPQIDEIVTTAENVREKVQDYLEAYPNIENHLVENHRKDDID